MSRPRQRSGRGERSGLRKKVERSAITPAVLLRRLQRMPSDRESEADDHELSSEAEEHELSLDEHGRTAISGTCDYRPRVWGDVVAVAAVPALVADCKAAYLKVTTQTAMTGITYSTNATYWVGADATPRTALERFALSVFQFHSRRAHFDP